MPNLVSRIARFAFGYDAVATNNRRRPPVSDVKGEDDHLNATERRKLVSTTRDLRRNYCLAAWAIRKHLDYVTSFSFQSKNNNKELDDRIEALVRWWDKPGHFDVAQRHGLRRFVRLAEACRTLDGDFMIYKLDTGFVQGLEGDRIANPTRATLPKPYKIDDFKRGVKTSNGGRAQAYIVNNRSKMGSSLEYLKVVPAKYIVQFAYWDRIDQTRGVSPLAPAINALQDTYEGITYALARAKVSQLMAFVTKRHSARPVGQITEDNEDEFSVDFGKGPVHLDIGPDDVAEFLESKQPSQEFAEFLQSVISLSLKALDIPYSFYAENFSNYSGSRQALLMYEQSAAEKRNDVRELLDGLLFWRLQIWIRDGVLVLPAGMTVNDLQWEWQFRSLPWIDPYKEAKGQEALIKNGLMSRQRILKRMGEDWSEIIDELEEEEKEISSRISKPAAPSQPTGDSDNNI